MKAKIRAIFSSERGTVTVITALGIIALAGFLALSVDLGQLYLVRNELQNVADAAALTGAKQLFQAQTGSSQYYYNAISAAQECARQNRSLGLSRVEVAEADVVIGKWDLAQKRFLSTGASLNPTDVNAVQVTVRRQGETNPPVPAFFRGIWGQDSMATAATAVAYLGLSSTSAPDLPFAIPAAQLAMARVDRNREGIWWQWLAPPPAYAAAAPPQITWKDLGGSPQPGSSALDITRGTFVTDKSSNRSPTTVRNYIKGTPPMPQIKVNGLSTNKLYPMSEWDWGSNIKDIFTDLKNTFNAKKGANGKWRVVVAVYGINPPPLAKLKDPWYLAAFRCLGVSQALACTAYNTPAVYPQGFAALDIVSVTVPSCHTGGDQVTDPNSCRNKCSITYEVLRDQNFCNRDYAALPTALQPTYRDMNPGANPTGVINAVPKLVK